METLSGPQIQYRKFFAALSSFFRPNKIISLIDLKLANYLKDSISLKKNNKALNDIDEVVKKVKKKLNYNYEEL